jgi:hypothetical protein
VSSGDRRETEAEEKLKGELKEAEDKLKEAKGELKEAEEKYGKSSPEYNLAFSAATSAQERVASCTARVASCTANVNLLGISLIICMRCHFPGFISLCFRSAVTREADQLGYVRFISCFLVGNIFQ